MGVNFGGPAVEVAIGLAFVFFLLSTVVSAITEGIAWLTKQRVRSWRKGCSACWAKTASPKTSSITPWSSPTLQAETEEMGEARSGRNGGSTKPRRNAPPISRRGTSPYAGRPLGETRQEGRRPAEERPERAQRPERRERRRRRHGTGAAAGGVHRRPRGQGAGALPARPSRDGSTTRWIASRVGTSDGRRRSAAFSPSSSRLGSTQTRLRSGNSSPKTRLFAAPAVSRAEAAAGEEKGDAQAAGMKAEDAVNNLEALELPLLWPDGFLVGVDFAAAIGLLILALAISLGAPFWFDALGKLAHLRTTGKKPDPKSEGTA